MEPAISLSNLRKTFGDHVAVDGLSFEVPHGSIFGLLGRNGAGKTTTIRMIMDIIRPDSGEVRVLGRPLDARTKDRVGYLPEERGLYPKMKVIEMLEFQGSIKDLKPGEARTRASKWLERMELGAWTEKKVEELSKGMQQKVQFIAAVIHEPELLILDEPFSGMDPVNQDLIKDLILEINRAGCSVIFSTHVMDSAERLCREIALIDHGRVVVDGALATIKHGFGNNALRLEYEGDGSFLPQLPQVQRIDDYGQYVEIQLTSGDEAQELLEVAVDRLRIRRFEIVAPTLHNIFIQLVGRGESDA
jgi:ABC-2 type transport system ATP-binding protein